MATKRKSVNLLPGAFQTEVNRKFLSATVDQLISEPNLININGYVGRTFAPTYKNSDSYIIEPTNDRQNYQLEPSIVVKNQDNQVGFFAGYTDLINKIKYYGGSTDNHNRLFENEFYSYNPGISYDKFVNFSQYYWLQNGPDAVSVKSTGVPLNGQFTITRNIAARRYDYVLNGRSQDTITLIRGGTYTFTVNQPGVPLWLQSEPGISGTLLSIPSVSSRNVLGVTNNGEDVGTITFQVPQKSEHQLYVSMPTVFEVDYAAPLAYADLHDSLLSEFKQNFPQYNGIVGQLAGKHLIFVDEQLQASRGEAAWTVDGITVPTSQRYGVWKVVFVDSGNDSDPLIRLQWIQNVNFREKVYVKYGLVNANLEFYKESTGFFVRVPLLTALQDELYIQDALESSISTRLKIVDLAVNLLDVEKDILGLKNYTSPNGIAFTSGLKISFGEDVTPETYQNKEFYVENVGDAINLVDVDLLVRPELYNDEIASQYPGQVFPEYITIKRDNLDLNAWSRNNRWFHIDIITKTAEYNNTEPVYDQKMRAQRPIVQYEGNLQLFNFGRIALKPIDILDTLTLDPFIQYEGKTITNAFGINLTSGLRVLFSQASDPLVRGRIYTLSLVQYDADPVTGNPTGPFYIKLDLDPIPVEKWDTLVVKQGQYKGSGWWYDGVHWRSGQEKTHLQQAPLFDVYDNSGESLSSYHNSSFKGTKLFGYAESSSGVADPVLGFPLKYKSFGNRGDIEFKNYFGTDVFSYDIDGVEYTKNVLELGFLIKILDRYDTSLVNCWNPVVESSKQYQIFTYQYDGSSTFEFGTDKQVFRLDVTPKQPLSIPTVKVFVNNIFLPEKLYTVAEKNVIIDAYSLSVGDRVAILVFSDEISKIAYYEIPSNLNLNAQNIEINEFTLGQIRNHLVALSQNSLDLDRPIIGPNNLRDLEIKSQGGTILQHSAPCPYASIFLLEDSVNFINAARLAQTEYTRFKNKFLELSVNMKGINFEDPVSAVDAIISKINEIKNITFPWYYSDMVPFGKLVTNVEYTVFDPLVKSYEISNLFDDTVQSNKAVLVYRNGIQLIKEVDYTFDKDRPGVTFTNRVPLATDDKIKFVEYQTTDGNYIPETPTKLGLYPKYLPEIIYDDTYRTPVSVIRGHDGSITPAFGDYRDELLLELEKRIYNNIKLSPSISFDDIWIVQPGKFRKANYSRLEITQILSKNFMRWAGTGRIDFSTNETFLANDEFTWNYSRFADKLDDEIMPGSWRACYLYYYDTVNPHTSPWEMLGFSIKPNWWEDFYGPAPYTGGNQVLWQDLEKGLIREGSRAGIDSKFARPGLSKIIPVDINGNLKSPAAIISKFSQSKNAATAWSVGDYGPAEWAWRTSSDFPFAVQQALAIAKPAIFFGLKHDVSKYQKHSNIKQFLIKQNNHHVRQQDFLIHGDTRSGEVVRAAGYVNYIADYLRSQGIDAGERIDSLIQEYQVNLAYKVAGFTDKNYLRILAEQSSPTSTNDSVLIPDENYKIHLYKSAPIRRVVYSGVIIEKTTNGYSVSGFNTGDPFFIIIPSTSSINSYRISVLNSEGVIFDDFQNIKLTVPYGYEFKNQQQVVDFLVSYERYLIAQGFIFNDIESTLGEIKDWKLSAKEFLFWAQQGWKPGSLLFLSPVANQINFYSEGTVVDKIDDSQYGTKILDQNFNLIRNEDYDIVREDGEFIAKFYDNTRTISLVELNLVQFEHVIVFDNATVFNDVIYKPELGNRQFRLKIIGQKTGDWDGSLYAPGFVFNEDNVPNWIQGKDYYRGDLVTYKNQFFVAMEDIPGESLFSFNLWKKINQTEIKTGLLRNFSTIALQGDYSYDSYSYFKDENQLRYSHSLIGFKPRRYLEDLGLDDTSQIEFYKGFIKQKGTANAILQLTKAEFNNLSSDIDFYEEWAVRVGEYGALNINPYVEFVLDESQFGSSPSVAQFVHEKENNLANGLNIFNLSYLYRQTGKYNGNIALNRDQNAAIEQDIPTAGYVNIDDVDATIFDLTNFSELNSQLANIGVGYTIWTAKDFKNDWNVFRVSETNNFIVLAENSLDNFLSFTSQQPHDLKIGDVFLVKYFSANIDGFYRVVSVEDLYKVVVEYRGDQIYYDNLISEEGEGVLFKLYSMRFLYMEDSRVFGLNNPLNYWKEGDKIWIDDDAATTTLNGQTADTPNNIWKVYEKTMPWKTVDRLEKQLSDYSPNDGYGTSVKLSEDSLYAAVGSPLANVLINGVSVQTGHVIVFNRNVSRPADAERYTQGATVVPTAKSNVNVTVREFGTSVDLAVEYMAVGAPGSLVGMANVGIVHVYNRPQGTLNYENFQVLIGNISEDGRFGQSISYDEFGNWLYISAPQKDKVYVYGLNSNIRTVSQRISVSDEKRVVLNGAITAKPGDILTQVSSFALDRLVLSSNVTVVEGQFITQTIGANTANAVVVAAAANSREITVREISGNIIVHSANLRVNGEFFTPNVRVSNSSQTTASTVVTATVVANVVSSNTVVIRSSVDLALGSGNLGISVGNLIQSGSGMLPFDTGLGVVANFANSIIDSVTLNFTPDLAATSPGNIAHSLLITDFSRVFIPQIDYTVSGNVVTFLGGNLAVGDYLIKQRPYYQLIDVLSGPTGSEFGYSLDSSLDGAQLAVGTPNDTVNVAIMTDGTKKSVSVGVPTANVSSYTEYRGSGSVYVYDRMIEAFTSTGALSYTTTNTLGLVCTVVIDGQVVTNYRYTAGTTQITFTDPPPVGKTIYVETNKFNLLEKLIGIDSLEGGLNAIQSNTRFGTDLTICSNNCAIYVGAPNYSAGTKYNIGAVWKFHNKGRLYGTNRGYLLNPTFVPNDTIRLDNFEVKVSLRLSDTIVTTAGSSLVGRYITQTSSGANARILESRISNGQTVLKISDYLNSNVFVIGSGVVSIDGISTMAFPVRTTLDDFVKDINDANLLGITASNEMGYLRIKSDSTVAKNLLRILSGRNVSSDPGGVSNVYESANMAVFAFMQIIVTPYSNSGEHFGNRVVLARNAYMLVISSDRGTTRNLTTVDADDTYFDDGSTEFFDQILGSGSVYIYELYDDPRNMVEHPGRYAFAQQLDPGKLNTGDAFGTDIDISGDYIIVSAPADDTLSYFTLSANVSVKVGDIITQPTLNLSRYEVTESVVNGKIITVSPTRNYRPATGLESVIFINGVSSGAYIESIVENTGSIYMFHNTTRTRGWKLIRYQEPKVDIESVNRIFLYNRNDNLIKTNIEFIDPAKGKILGVAEQELTYKTAYDPAFYNRGTENSVNINQNLFWGPEYVGKVWWNLDKSRFIEYEQSSIVYRSVNWGRLFPGSVIEISEWIESTGKPSQHADLGLDGDPLYPDDSAYVEVSYVDTLTNIISSKYYYWATNKNTVDVNDPSRKLTTTIIKDLILNPKSQNIPYAAIIRSDAVAFNNIKPFLSAGDVVCHIDYESVKNNSIIHSEYECIQSGNPFSFIPEKMSSKLIDSLAGQDLLGKVVPDPLLSTYDRYGVSYRPRQTMFVDSRAAMSNLVTYVNNILIKTPIIREYEIPYFFSEDPLPSSLEYDLLLISVDELQFVDANSLAEGYRVLVKTDLSQDGLWVIYQLDANKSWTIYKTQSYKTSLYWEYLDWYAEGFDPTEVIEFVVDTLVDALKLPVNIGDEILVRINIGVVTNGWNLLTVLDDGSYRVVGIEKGTIRLKENLYNFAQNKLGFSNQTYDDNRFDQNPSIEIRNILLGLKENIFVRSLSGEWNRLFFVMINYLLTEQKYVDWIFKTSFIGVTHNLRSLIQYPNFVKDNQTYYLDYINEVKPYSTKVREYTVRYSSDDQFVGDLTDFDLPPYYDREQEIFRSPNGDQEKDLQMWTTGFLDDKLINIDYPSWYQNRTHVVEEIIIEDPGLGYSIEPIISIVGGGNTVTRTATGKATINSNTGALLGIEITDSGAGYTQTPTVIVNGSATQPAKAYAVLKNHQVRSFDSSLKFDRISYGSSVKEWKANTAFAQTQTTVINGVEYWVGGDIITRAIVEGSGFVRHAYKVKSNIVTSSTFVAEDFEVYPAANFTSAGDRILGYYQPTGNMPGRNLDQLLSGIDYPGVIVQGVAFSETPGYSGEHQANITFSNAIGVSVGSIIRQPESYGIGRFLLNLSNKIPAAYIGQFIDQSNGANATVYGNTVLHGNLLGTLGDVINSQSIYILRNNGVAFDTNANIRISGVEQVISTWGNVVNTIVNGFETTTNIAPYRWSNVGVRPIVTTVGNVTYTEIPIPPAELKVTKVWSNTKVQGVVNSTQPFITGSTSLTGGRISVDNSYFNSAELTFDLGETRFDINSTIFDSLIISNARPISIEYISSKTASSYDLYGFDNSDSDADGQPILSESTYDTLISSYYSDAQLGFRPEDINIDGGQYVDTYSSHAPEELIPGIVLDTLDMKVVQLIPDTSPTFYILAEDGSELLLEDSGSMITEDTFIIGNIANGYRMFVRNFQFTATASTSTCYSETTYLRLCDDAASPLAQPLALADTEIQVIDASRFPAPNPEISEPGVVFIGAERITYYERNLVTNRLSRIRRGTKGTAAKSLYPAGALVVDASKQQLIPGTTWANVSYNPNFDLLTLDLGETRFDRNSTTFDSLRISIPVSSTITGLLYNISGNLITTGLTSSTLPAAKFIMDCNATGIEGEIQSPPW